MTLTIDAHQHVWGPDLSHYSWLASAPPELQRTFNFDDFQPVLDRCGIHGSVLVQAADNQADTRHMLDIARQDSQVVAVVAWAPLGNPNQMPEHLDRLAAQPIVRGVRNLFHLQLPGWSTSPQVHESLAILAETSLTLDFVTASHEALAAATDITRRHPTLAIVIDHLGKPPVGGTKEDRLRWKQALSQVAEHGSTYAKVSGLYPATGPADHWTVTQIRPFVEDALELFGAQRLMYGGDWPLCDLTGGYERWFTALRSIFDELSADERSALLAGTASQFYGIQTLLEPQ